MPGYHSAYAPQTGTLFEPAIQRLRDDLTVQLNHSEAKMLEKITWLEGRIGSLEADRTEPNEILRRLEIMDKYIHKTVTKLGELETRINGLDRRVDTLGAHQADLQTLPRPMEEGGESPRALHKRSPIAKLKKPAEERKYLNAEGFIVPASQI